MPQDAIVEIDLHGKNSYQDRVAIDAALRRHSRTAYRIRLIHGHNLGTALRDFIWDTYSDDPRVLRLTQGMNPGITELVLREY